LVDQQTSVYFLRQGLNQIKIYGPDDVRERFDLEPKQLIDFKALRGDASDNIKGVPGIGEKNALDLIKKFKNLENVYAYIESKEKQESIKPTIIKILKENKKQAILSKELVTIKQEISGLNSEKLKPLNKMDYEKISNTLKEFGFKSLMKRIGDFNLANQTTLF